MDEMYAMSKYHDWLDFAETVCRPIVEIEDDENSEVLHEAMARFHEVPSFYIACALVMAANRVRDIDRKIDE